MHTSFQGSLLLVTGREGESPGNEVAVVTRVPGGINIGFWETAHLPLPLPNILP